MEQRRERRSKCDLRNTGEVIKKKREQIVQTNQNAKLKSNMNESENAAEWIRDKSIADGSSCLACSPGRDDGEHTAGGQPGENREVLPWNPPPQDNGLQKAQKVR